MHDTHRTNFERCEKHVALGEAYILRQRQIIERLDQNGLDAGWARDLLNSLEKLQLLHIEHRDYFRERIAAGAPDP